MTGTDPIIKVDAYKMRKLRQDLSRRFGFEVTQEYISEKAGITRALISYMENPKSKRRFSFETVFLITRFYREALKDPQITCEYLALQRDRMRPRPVLAEDQATYQARARLMQVLHDKLTDLFPNQLTTLDHYLDFVLAQQRHQENDGN